MEIVGSVTAISDDTLNSTVASETSADVYRVDADGLLAYAVSAIVTVCEETMQTTKAKRNKMKKALMTLTGQK
jgi:hypothetical protein